MSLYFILIALLQINKVAFAKLCVPDVNKNMIKVFNLMSRTNKTRFVS